jgi:hypothetical protein
VTTPARHPDLCWLFVDTTGLHTDTHEVIGVAYARGSDEMYFQFYPTGPVDSALEQINGYNPVTWGDKYGIDRNALALVHVQRAIAGSVLAGHTLVFHGLFLRKLFGALGLAYPSAEQRRIDLPYMFAPLAMAGLVDGLSLGALCKAVDVPLPTPANAWDRLDCARQVYDRYFEVLGLSA